MFSAILTFFSSFNPIVFAAILGAGAVTLVRRPGRQVALRPTIQHEGTGKSYRA